jgi:uncharacterized membrane protein YgdD (TMEM256/DUF423 family)
MIHPFSLGLDSMDRLFIMLGSFNAFLAVGFGAFGAHGLKTRIPVEMLTVYQTGVHYHLFHAIALLCIGLLAQNWSDSFYLKVSGWLFLTGIILFSGSLYALSMSGLRYFGLITPFGGMAFLAGWVFLILAAWKVHV